MEEPPVRQAARFGESQLEHWLAAVQSRRRKGAEMNLNQAIAPPLSSMKKGRAAHYG